MSGPKVGVECIYAGREGSYAHAHNTVPENYPRLTHITCV